MNRDVTNRAINGPRYEVKVGNLWMVPIDISSPVPVAKWLFPYWLRWSRTSANFAHIVPRLISIKVSAPSDSPLTLISSQFPISRFNVETSTPTRHQVCATWLWQSLFTHFQLSLAPDYFVFSILNIFTSLLYHLRGLLYNSGLTFIFHSKVFFSVVFGMCY